MTRVKFRFFLFCFVTAMNLVPFYFAFAVNPGEMWHVWRKKGSCSMSRQDWLAVAQDPPGYGWQVCNGSKAHFTFTSAAAEMDALKIRQCNADMPNCPRFQNDCCEVQIWEHPQSGDKAILKEGDTPPMGWQLSPLNSPTQCCEEAAVAAGINAPCRQLALVSVPGVIVTFNGPGQFTSSASTPTIIPSDPPIVIASLGGGNTTTMTTSKHQPPTDVQVDPEDDDFPWEEETPSDEPQPPVTPQPPTVPTPPTPQAPTADRWMLESVTVNPEDPSKVWTHPEEMKWEYSKDSTSAQFTLSGGATGDSANYQWSPPPQQVNSSGFTINISVQSPKSSASIGVSGPGGEGAVIVTNSENTGGSKSATFKPSGDSFEVTISLGWGSVKYHYNYRHV